MIYFGVPKEKAQEFIFMWHMEQDAMTLKTYLVEWQTACGTSVCIVNAYNEDDARRLVITEGDARGNIEVHQINTAAAGVVAQVY